MFGKDFGGRLCSVADPFFVPGEQRSEKVHELFSIIAQRYDLINDLQSFGLHRYWKRKVIRLADVQPGDSALDVCCGTGDLTFALARHGARAVGLDFNQEMLQVAQTRIPLGSRLHSEQGTDSTWSLPGGIDQPSSVRFVRGDAQKLPFPDNSFDVVTIGYGLRNLAMWESGLREMQRVAKAGARLLVLEFGKPDNRLLRAVYFGYLRVFVPLLGRIVCGNADAYAYILESLKYYPAQKGVATKMAELGLCDTRTINILGGMMSINFGINESDPRNPLPES